MLLNWISDNWIELFGAITGILYVFLEIRQNLWLWPVGIITSTVYIWIFFTSKFYADMSLQVYYLIISCVGWYWWSQGIGHTTQDAGGRAIKNDPVDHFSEGASLQGRLTEIMNEDEKGKNVEGEGDSNNSPFEGGQGDVKLQVTHLHFKTGLVLTIVFVLLYFLLWFILSRFTDSPVPEADSFITSLSIVATWMLARKIYEHWYLWIIVNTASAILFIARGLYPTVFLYFVYFIMSFTGIKVWKKFCVKRET
jgi:nicotinamide mononucleotide transporter